MCIKLHGLEKVNLVMDPFMGIVSTAIAFQKLEKNFAGFEIDELYFAEAIKNFKESIDK